MGDLAAALMPANTGGKPASLRKGSCASILRALHLATDLRTLFFTACGESTARLSSSPTSVRKRRSPMYAQLSLAAEAATAEKGPVTMDQGLPAQFLTFSTARHRFHPSPR